MRYYRVENHDTIEEPKFKRLSDAKSYIRDNFTMSEKLHMFNRHASANIYQYNDKKDGSFYIVGITPFICDEKGTHFKRTIKY